MTIRRTLTIIAFLHLCCGVLPTSAQNSKVLETEICSDLDSIRTTMKKTLHTIIMRHHGDSLFCAKLATAQKAWQHYVDAQIAMKFPEPDTFETYGEMYPMCLCLERVRFTEARVAELGAWAEKNAAGDGCPGSALVEE